MCKRIPEYPDYGDGVNTDEPFCYVHQPSSCPDLKQSEVYNMLGEKYSSFACKQNQGKWIDSQIFINVCNTSDLTIILDVGFTFVLPFSISCLF